MPDLEAEARRQGVSPPTDKTLARYGMNREDWLTLLAAQDWRCPICLRKNGRWNVDHEHVPGWKHLDDENRKRHVRGILCWHCNHTKVHSTLDARETQRIADYIAAYEARRDASTDSVSPSET